MNPLSYGGPLGYILKIKNILRHQMVDKFSASSSNPVQLTAPVIYMSRCGFEMKKNYEMRPWLLVF